MKNISISTFINIIFSIAIIFICLAFGIFIKLDQQKHRMIQHQRYEIITKSVLSYHNFTPKIIDDLEKKLDIKYIDNSDLKLKILNQAITIYQKEYINIRLRVFNLDDKYYIYIQRFGLNMMFLDKVYIRSNILFIAIAFVFVLLMTLLLYILFRKKLKPLKELNNSIQQFSKGDFSVHIDIKSKDEIGQISDSFNQAITNINLLINSKNLFMRNIMHELKTPITKNLFLINMIETKQTQDKELLIKNLNLMNDTINELANIEKLKTDFLNLQKESINILQLLQELIANTDISEVKIINNTKNPNIVVNRPLFVILLKNLLTNGYKYATDHHIYIKILDNQIVFKTKGDKLSKDLEYYTQPFSQETKNSQGLGLGLYIANEIAILHHYRLHYWHDKGYNNFSLVYDKRNINKTK